MNEIPEKQNQEAMLRLLRARRRVCSTAKVYQGTVVLVTLALPVFSLVAAAFFPVARPYIAAAALVFTMCEVVFMDRWQKGLMKIAAKMQEEFDCFVLQLRPNEFVVGDTIDPEETHRLGDARFDDAGEASIRDWYPVSVGRLPLHAGRVLCQRENLLYDSDVRKRFGQLLRGGLIAILLLLVGYSLVEKLTLDQILLTVAAPAMPGVSWALREFFRQRDTIDTLQRLKTESEKLWRKVLAGMPEQEAVAGSRELQDAIYNHRVASPLVFDFLYRFGRTRREASMNAGAERRAGEFLDKNLSTT